jgi:hypothetical protein
MGRRETLLPPLPPNIETGDKKGPLGAPPPSRAAPRHGRGALDPPVPDPQCLLPTTPPPPWCNRSRSLPPPGQRPQRGPRAQPPGGDPGRIIDSPCTYARPPGREARPRVKIRVPPTLTGPAPAPFRRKKIKTAAEARSVRPRDPGSDTRGGGARGISGAFGAPPRDARVKSVGRGAPRAPIRRRAPARNQGSMDPRGLPLSGAGVGRDGATYPFGAGGPLVPKRTEKFRGGAKRLRGKYRATVPPATGGSARRNVLAGMGPLERMTPTETPGPNWGSRAELRFGGGPEGSPGAAPPGKPGRARLGWRPGPRPEHGPMAEGGSGAGWRGPRGPGARGNPSGRGEVQWGGPGPSSLAHGGGGGGQLHPRGPPRDGGQVPGTKGVGAEVTVPPRGPPPMTGGPGPQTGGVGRHPRYGGIPRGGSSPSEARVMLPVLAGGPGLGRSPAFRRDPGG